MAFPNSVMAGEEDVVLQVCLVNQGKSRQLTYNDFKKRNEISITLLAGMETRDLVTEVANISCTPLDSDWACDVEDVAEPDKSRRFV